jgi:hypothetical protein
LYGSRSLVLLQSPDTGPGPGGDGAALALQPR